MSDSTLLSTAKSIISGKHQGQETPDLAELRFRESSQTSYSDPPRTEDEETIQWIEGLKVKPMTGACSLDNRPSVNVGNIVTVDGGNLELCQDCYGKPLGVLLLQLANLNRRVANMPPPSSPRQ